MYASFISTRSFAGVSRQSVLDIQSELAKSSQEVTTGRPADPGLALGALTGRSVTLRNKSDALDSLITSNKLTASRLDVTQTTLSGVSDTANSLLDALIALPTDSQSSTALMSQARDALDRLTAAMNTSGSSGYIFAGIDTANKPFADYSGAPKVAVDAAQAAFVASLPPPATSIADATATDVQTFLSGPFAALFADPAWQGTWSSASDTNVTTQVAPGQVIDTGTNANAPAIRELTMAYTMIAGLDLDQMNDHARAAVVSAATTTLGKAVGDLTGLSSQLGFVQQSVSQAADQLQQQKDVTATRLSTLESVDPYTAKVENDTLTNQLQMAYATTTGLLGLSILNYA